MWRVVGGLTEDLSLFFKQDIVEVVCQVASYGGTDCGYGCATE